MASPFKRICLQTSLQRISRPAVPCQRHPTRPISTTPSRLAEEAQPSPNAPSEATDPLLDNLAKQPGVKYTVTEEAEDLRQIDVSNLSSLAHRELAQHREIREMTRVAAWEMPLLSRLAKPFTPPSEQQVLRWRYTTYMGEAHPAARKVVVEFRPERLGLSEAQVGKLKKLVGVRYNPGTGVVKMSCESFETQAENKRFLADTISALLTSARDPEEDSFADIPLDTRHYKVKERLAFPKEWRMTPERRKELDEKRRATMFGDAKRIEEGVFVDGMKVLEEAVKGDLKREEEPVMARAAQRLPVGKMGKKEMGQRRG